jgi:hypothetical protein
MITPNDIERLMAEVLSIMGQPEEGKMEREFEKMGFSNEFIYWLGDCGAEGISFLSMIGNLQKAGSTLMLSAFYLGFLTHKEYGETKNHAL